MAYIFLTETSKCTCHTNTKFSTDISSYYCRLLTINDLPCVE